MKVLVDLVAFVSGVAIASVAMAGVVIPSGPEHRELHSVVLFTGGTKVGDAIHLNIQALQDGDFIQYIGVVSSDCSHEYEDGAKCLRLTPATNALEMGLFSQAVENHQIRQLVNADLDGTVFLASILKKQ